MRVNPMYDRFEELFPKTAPAFDLNGIDAIEWVAMRRGVMPQVAWELVLCAGDLLARCASWRQPTNVFQSPRFTDNWGRYRKMSANMAGKLYAKNSFKKPVWKGFIDFRLDAEQLAELDDWTPNAAEVFAYVDEAMNQGYRFSLSYSSVRGLATCTMFDDDKTRASAGYAISTSDRDGSLALKGMVFKHALVLERDWSKLVADAPQGGQRG